MGPILPEETMNCFDLPPVTAGRVELSALTLRDVVILARAGIDVLGPLDAGEVAAVFELLSGEAGAVARPHDRAGTEACPHDREGAVARPHDRVGAEACPHDRAGAVARVLEIAFRNAVPGHVDGERKEYMRTGYGWPLEVAERLMHEYGMGFDEAAGMPLVRCYSLLACARVRGGGKAGGPDYWERVTVPGLTKGGSR